MITKTTLRPSRFVKPSGASSSSSGHSTRHLYVCGLGDSLKTPELLIRSIFEPYGELNESLPWGPIDYPEGKRYVFVSYRNLADAEKAYTDLGDGKPIDALNGGKLYIRYAERAVEEEARGPSVAECTSTTRDVKIPGLILVENFISEEEADCLWNLLDRDDAPWEEGLSRRVQHYGVPFNYRTLMLDYNRKVNPIPTEMHEITQKMIEFASKRRQGALSSVSAEKGTGTGAGAELGQLGERGVDMPPLSLGQLTVNEYEPGQGIAAHIDTFNCFGPEIFVLSLGSGVTMNMVKRRAGEEGSEDGADTEGGGGAGGRKAVWLPPRSLLLLTGEARYAWSHAIPSRLTDKVDGELKERKRRISLTFREALLPNDQAEFVGASSVEVDHVFRVYDNIAVHWNHTRGKRKVHWGRVKAFLENLSAGSLLADIGSGDGKYFGLNPGVVCVGCDRSWNLLRVSHEPTHETLCCDIVRLPYLDGIFDATICVAVLHHLASKDRRVAAVRELVRITRPGGRVLIQAWAKEQEENSRLTFVDQDVLVPWRLQQRFFEGEGEGKVKGKDKGKSEGEGKGETSAQGGLAGQAGGSEALLPATLQSPEGPCQHVKEDEKGALVFQRYCHVYRKGELEDLCSSVPGACVEEAGWDRGNWFVLVRKQESALMDLPLNPRQYSQPSFVSRKDADTGEQLANPSLSLNNPNAGMGQGNDMSFHNGLRVVEVNNRAKKDVGVKQGTSL